MFELTVFFNIEKIGAVFKTWLKLRIKWNFELTVFDLAVSDLYKQMNVNNYISWNIDDNQWHLKPTPVGVENYTWKCWICLHVPMGETEG